jgi:hypothetical protein
MSAKETLVDLPSVIIALPASGILFKFKKLLMLMIHAIAAFIGL